MVQITKTLKKSLKPPPSLQSLIEKFIAIPENEIGFEIEKLSLIGKNGWIWQKTDMFHWVGVLNRFDRILDSIVSRYNLPLNQSSQLPVDDKYLAIQIIILTMALWDNSTNRSLYNSYEHLINLLGVCEPDLLYWTLRLLMKPALRFNAQKSLKTPYNLAIPILLVLGQKEITSAVSPSFSYYRTAKELKDLNSSPKDSNIDTSMNTIAATDGEGAEKKAAAETTITTAFSKFSSHVSILIPSLENSSCNSILESYKELKETFKVSVEHCRDLLHKIRLFNMKDSIEYSSYFTAIRYSALVILAQLLPEEQAEMKLFTADPDLVVNACNLLIHPTELPHSLRFIACSLVDGLSHYRGKMTEVLGAINASTNHGHIIKSIRRVLEPVSVDGMTESTDYNIEFIESLFNFISYLMSSTSGGNMLTSAGLVPILQSCLASAQTPIKVVTKCIGMLDMIQSDTPTTQIEVGAVVERIKTEVEYCLSLKSGFKDKDFVYSTLPDPGTHFQFRELLARTPLLRSMMKLILHLQQTSATSDSMRRLIDSSLPQTLKTVFIDSKLFSVGVGVFGLAVNIMSTFVHTEPTSLAILQEQGVVSSFLDSSRYDIPPSPEVVSALPNAFGAVCLNVSGLDAFIAANPIPKFLTIFTLKQHLPSLIDNDVPHLVGNSIDELIRHHPTTRDIIMKAVVELVEQVVLLAQGFERDTGCRLLIEGEPDGSSPVEYVTGTDIKIDLDESRAAQYIDVLSRFIEGLFQNTAHCKEFIKFGGLKPLLSLYSLPSLPFDFATSSSSASVSYLFRTIVDVNGLESTPIIYEAISQLCREIDESGMFDGKFDESIFLPLIRISVTDSSELKLKAQSMARQLVVLKCYLRLLNDVYCSNSLSHSKSIASLIDLFSPDRSYSLLSFFGKAARVSSLERLLVVNQIPEGWLKSPDKKDGGSDKDKAVEGADSCAGKNAKFIYTLLEDIPLDLSAFFRGILKTISHRRVLSERSRKVSQDMIDQISNESVEALSWGRGVESQYSFDYLTLALSHLRGLICEERGSGSLFQAYVAFSISRKATFNSLLDLSKSLVVEKLPLLLTTKTPESTNEESEKSILKLSGVIDIISDICQCLVSDKYQQESPHTATLYARLKDNGPNSFDPVAFLVEMRIDIFPSLVELFLSSNVSHLSNYAINRIVGTILLVLKHEGEQSSTATRNAGPPSASGLPFSIAALSQQIFGNRAGAGVVPVGIPTVPAPAPRADPAKVDILCDMGFPRPAAEIALIRCGNSVSRAADYLLTHPEVLSHQPTPAGPSVSTTPPVAVSSSEIPPVDANPTAVDQTAPIDATTPSSSANVAALASSNDASAEVNDAMQLDPTDEHLEESSEFVIEEPPTEALGSDKGEQVDKSLKIREQNLEKLVNMRAERSESIYRRALSLLAELESISLVFGLKELLCIENSKIATIVSELISSLTEYHDLISSGVYTGDEASKKKVQTGLYLHYHMLALLVSDSKTSKAIEIQKSVLSSNEFMSLSPLSLLSRVTDFQQWISPLLLVLESYISYSDEPVEVELRAEPALFQQEPVAKAEKILMETKIHMIIDLIRILKIESLDVNSLHVLLQLIARLTLKWPVAVAFVENGGFQALFNSEKFAVFPSHQSIVMIIARHCLEDPALLQSLMKEELKRFFNHPRARSVDLAFLIKSCGHIIVRSTDDFISAIGSVCKLNSYSAAPSIRAIQVSLQESALVNSAAKNGDTFSNTPSATPFKFSSSSKIEDLTDVSKVVQFLTGQLIALKQKEANESRYITQCFLLQSLCELFVSFPKAKVDFLKSSMKKSNKQTPKPNSAKNLIIGYLLHEVVPIDLLSDDVTAVPKEEIERRFLSIWASQFLAALCYTKQGYLDDSHTNELQAIRVLVVESILKVLKDSINQSENVAFEIRYGKIVSLATLCFDLLNPTAVVTSSETTSLENHSLAIAKIMIEKGFVSVFTSSLASLDVNHPCSSKVVLSFLKPLDKLASAAIQIGKTLEILGGGSMSTKSKKAPSLFDNALRDLEDEGSAIEQTPNEISDMFRNSALGMLEPSLGNGSNSADSDHSEDEDEFDEFDEMDEEGMDDDEMDEDSDADDDMEIVVPQPYHGGQDENGDGETSSDDDISHLQNPFLDQNEPVIDVESESDEDGTEDEDDDPDDDENPEDVEMFLENHLLNNDDTGDEDDEDLEEEEEDDGDVDGQPMTLAQLMNGGNISATIPVADLADIEDVFGEDNGNMMLEEAEDEDGEEHGPTGFLMPSQRAHRRMQQVFGGNLGNEIQLQWYQGGRAIDPANFTLPSGRAPNALNSAVVHDMTHPLLVNHESNFVGTNPNSRNAASNSRQLLNEAEEAGTIQLELLEQLLMNSTRPGQSMIRPPNATLFNQRSPSLPQPVATVSEADQQKANIHSYTLSFTEDRWKQDSKLQYGNYVIEKAMKTGNSILNRLLPAAYEVKLRDDREKEEKMRIEEEKKKEDEEKKRAEEEERKKAEAASAPTNELPSDQLNDVEMATASSSSAQPIEPAPAPAEDERIVVMIDGNPVDITGSGIDVTFLEALPDELRLEVVNQHFRERELNRARDEIGATSELNPEFLDALPFEIREEVIRQERLETEQREASARRAARASETVAVAASGVPALPRESAAVADDPASSSSKSKSATSGRESIQLVDSSNIASLLRLVFVPDPTTKDGIYALLSHLCQNSKSRSEIVGLLISVLNAGSTDLASVDRTFAQLTLKTSRLSSSIISKEDSSCATAAPESSDFVPNVVAQRCLEALIYLSSSVSSVGKYFLTETEPSLHLMKPIKSKKSKGKEKISQLVYPVIQLLNLLEQPSLLSNSSALEKLMHLLSNVLRPLSHIAKKKFASSLKHEKALPANALPAIEEVDPAASDSGKISEVTKGESKPESSLKEKEPKTDIKLPILAESSVCNVVKVLKDGTTSSKSFQFTLSVIQYLCSYPAHLNIVVLELLNSAQSLGDLMLMEIDLLLDTLKAATGESSLNAMILEKFTSVGATQAKLLRILKTIDFLFAKTNEVALKFPYIAAVELFKSVKEDALPTEVEVLDKLYNQLKFGKLWQKLGETMSIIDGQESLVHVGTVLLPFIEAFMVVSKPSVSIMKRLHNTERGSMIFVKQQSELLDIEPDGFILFAESNKRVLNTMVRNNPSLMNGSFALLVQNPKVLEFDNKRTYFNQQLHKGGRRNHQQIQIHVRRQYVFEESYQQLQGRSGEAIKYGKFNVRFRDEEGVDAGGVTREWFSALALQMFNPDYALFRPSAADRVTYQPNRASGINPDHLFYFKFVGRIIGKAIYDNRLLDAHFTRSFYKCMISAPVDHKDMEAIDPEFYKSLDWILNNNITDVLDLNFSLELDDFGRRKIIDLKEDGRNVPVTEANKNEYVRLVTEQKLVVAIQDQIQAFLSGFHEIIPKDLIKIFNEQELELLISGLPDIDIDDWKNNTEYQNYTASSTQIQWFWRAVRSFSQEERAKLIQFATGTSKVPLGGFTQLQGSNGIQKFQIHKEFSSTTRLPSAHTCFNQIDLPQYESYEQLRSLLLVAVNESEGFGFV